jgi:hypothetical protein
MDTARDVAQWECTHCGWITHTVPDRTDNVDPRYPWGKCACWKRSKAEPFGRVFKPYRGTENVVASSDQKALQLFLSKHNTPAFKSFLYTMLDLQPAASFEVEEATGELHQTVSAKISFLAGIGVLVPQGRHRIERDGKRGTEAVAYAVTPSVEAWLKEQP